MEISVRIRRATPISKGKAMAHSFYAMLFALGAVVLLIWAPEDRIGFWACLLIANMYAAIGLKD